jgi:hypothetical protein
VCKMVQSMKEYMFIVEPFYQTSSFVWVQRPLWRKFNRWQAPPRYAIIYLVQKTELIGSVCKNKKGVVGMYRSSHTWENAACVHETLFYSLRISVTWCSQSCSIKQASTDTIMWENLTLYPYKIQVVQMLTVTNKQQRHSSILTFCAAVPSQPQTACSLVTKPISTLMGSWTRTQGSRPLKIHTESWSA